MTVSFGIEFEFDVIHRTGRIISSPWPEGRVCIPTWGYQADPTAGVELRTPVLTSIENGLEQIKQQFEFWANHLETYAPYTFNGPGRSLGQHIHVGRANRPLNVRERKALAHATANVYPFLAALQAQPLPSSRGLTTRYASPIWLYNWDIPNADHYCEISASHNGTVEFRLFDANIPQVALVNAWLLTEIAKKAFSRSFNGIEVDRERYRRDREIALRYGLRALDVRHYLEYLKSVVGDIRIPNHAFIKEILYLAVKYRLNAYNILNSSHVNRFMYFRKTFTDPSRYMEHVIGLSDISRNNSLIPVFRDVVRNSENVSRLSDLLELVGKSIPTVTPVVEIPMHSRNLPARSYVANCVANRDYRIRRIREVYGMSVYDVAERIQYLIRHHGDGYVNEVSVTDIVEGQTRYYVFTIYNEVTNREDVIACIGITVSTGEVSSLVVDRRYRRLGIATILMDYVRSVAQRPLSGYVRKANQPMLGLLQRLGFRLRPGSERSYMFTQGD
jgi:GNAT superfamily N-acetyltransferase